MRRETACTADSLTVGMMAKYWEIGKVKTRLGATIGMPQAAHIHRIFVQHLCSQLSDVGDHRSLCLAPIERRAAVIELLQQLPQRPNWLIIDQADGDLGARMRRWFQAQLSGQTMRAVLIGADCPTINVEVVETAARRLKDHDVVIGPAADGGYYLIGIAGSWAEIGTQVETLFRDIPWSTADVLKLTRQRAAEADLSLSELSTMEDVDTFAELQRLLDRLGTGGGSRSYQELKSAIEQILTDPHLTESA